jgi:hypothetical protein
MNPPKLLTPRRHPHLTFSAHQCAEGGARGAVRTARIRRRRPRKSPPLLKMVLLALSLGYPGRASAQWTAQVTGPDVFGNTKVVAGIMSFSGDGLIVQCDADSLDLVWVVAAPEALIGEWVKTGNTTPASLAIRVDAAPVETFDAQITIWNNTHMGIIAHSQPQTLDTIRKISAAKRTVDVGAEILGSKQSESFGTFGSTSAMSSVTKNCKLGGERDNSAPK